MNKRETDRLFMEKLRMFSGFSNEDIAVLATASRGRFQRLVVPYLQILKKEMEHTRRRRPKTT